ncbi:MAG TPA: cation transporter, partial [Longimicrobiaceae bacterium]|nr:cation transporter [Longimicrobiaceae bacterium]
MDSGQKPTLPVVQLGMGKPRPPAGPVPGAERVDLPITGMHCAACARRVEASLARAPGVHRAGVNLATSMATVEYDPAATGVRDFIRVVEDAGYGAVVPSDSAADALEEAHAAEYAEVRRKFWIAAILSLPVLVMAMSHGRIAWLDFPGAAWVQLLLTTPVVFYCGAQFYRGAWASFRHRAADMNTLIAVGTGTAYLYSVAATVFPRFFAAAARGGGMAGMGGMAAPVYYEAASVIIALLLLGRMLESRAKGRTS